MKMIEISEIEYDVTTDISYCDGETIYIGLPKHNNLIDKEITDYVADTIVHEYIHHILNELFSIEVSCLFDAIGDRLKKLKLTKKVFNCYEPPICLWQDFILEKGFNALLDYYTLDKNLVLEILKYGV